MNKVLSLITTICLLSCTAVYSQDSVKKAAPKKVYTAVRTIAPGTKPVVATSWKKSPYGPPVPGTYRYKKMHPELAAKADSAKPKPAYITPVTAQPVATDNSLNGQYNALLKVTERWQQNQVLAFHKSVMDTINFQKRKLKETQSALATATKTIASLQGDVSSKEQTLTESQNKVNSVSFLGMPMAKGTYNVIMWGLVLVLGGSLAAVIFLSASSRREAAYRIQLHDELNTEFQAYKVKANEKEKKLARELQTERNKLDDLMGR
jgi:hypothetical protein